MTDRERTAFNRGIIIGGTASLVGVGIAALLYLRWDVRLHDLWGWFPT